MEHGISEYLYLFFFLKEGDWPFKHIVPASDSLFFSYELCCNNFNHQVYLDHRLLNILLLYYQKHIGRMLEPGCIPAAVCIVQTYSSWQYNKDSWDRDEGKDVTCLRLLKLLKYRLKIVAMISITSESILSMDLVAILSLTAEDAVSGPVFSIYLQKKDDLMKTLHAVRRVRFRLGRRLQILFKTVFSFFFLF